MEIRPYDRNFKRENFDCGIPSLNNYILKNVSKDVLAGACVCFVTVNEENEVMAYYTLSSDSLSKELAPEAYLKKIKYDYFPVTLLGRRAVKKRHSGKGIVKLLLFEVLKRSC